MRLPVLLVVFLFACSTVSFGQTLRSIAVIGSSTAAGTGPVNIANSWANRTKAYYMSLGLIDTLYNIAKNSSRSFVGLPTGDSGADVEHNVNKALSFDPEVVIISYPSNDFTQDPAVSLSQYMANMRRMYNFITAAGKPCYITTTQPVNIVPPVTSQLMKTVRDSVIMEFGAFSLDFWDSVVNPATLQILPVYQTNPPDGIHLNDSGHAVLFNIVKAANVVPGIPLPLKLNGFNAQPNSDGVLLNWSTSMEDPGTQFTVQRSSDGKDFEDLQTVAGRGTAGGNYSWTDPLPPSGAIEYRLKINSFTGVLFSSVVSIHISGKPLGINRIYSLAGRGGFVAEINSPLNQPVQVTLIDLAGAIIRQRSYSLSVPVTSIALDMSNFAAGLYFLKVTTMDGKQVTRQFVVY
jgi:lysophospholipase L1-like esterase